MMSDLKFALRQLAKAPGFTATVVLTLALCIGACTVVFSVLDQIVLRPRDFPEPDRIVVLRETKSGRVVDSDSRVSWADFVDWHREAKSFQALGLYGATRVTYTGGAEPLALNDFRFTADMPRVWRDSPVAGRWFSADECVPGHEKVVVLAHGFWQRVFGGRSDVVGQTIQLDGEPWTIIGVTSEKWSQIYPGTDVVRPMVFDPGIAGNQLEVSRGFRQRECHGLLKPGVTIAQAQAEMDLIMAQLAAEYPDTNTGEGVKIVSRVDNRSRVLPGVLWMLLAAVGCVLLIGCANVANLLLARATVRQREISVRAAIGASRAQLLRQLLTESLVLALLGGVAGVLLAHWGLGAVQALIPDAVAHIQLAQIDTRILLFSLGLTIATGLSFGLAPAWLAAQANPGEALKQGARGSTESRPRAQLRGALVALQVACSAVLLAGAGVFVRSFVTLIKVNPGFDAARTTTMKLAPSTTRYGRGEQTTALMDALLERVRAIPGVEFAAGTTRVPFKGRHGVYGFIIEGRPPAFRSQSPTTIIYSTTPDFFRAAGVPLRRGRMFTDQDNRSNAAPVALINETLAKQQFPDEDPIGKRIRLADINRWSEIIGVVADFKEDGLDQQTHSQFFVPFAQNPWDFQLIVRHASHPAAIHAALKQQVYALDPDLPIQEIIPLADRVNATFWRERFVVQLLATFSLVALVIAAIGIYGVIAYSVTQRTTEIGIRMALGANEADVLWQELRRGMTLVGIGLAIGLLMTLALGRLVQSLLFNTSPQDPLTLAAVAVILGGVALFACWLPARRATKVDPIVALRAE
jgi:putative ABC transport system permease protein